MGMNTHQIARAKAAVSGGAEQSAPVAENSSVKTATDMAFDAIEPHFEKLAAQLGRWIDPKKFVASCVNAIARDPNLIRALHDAPRTVIGAIYQAAECGFEPNTPLGNCYMIPRYAKDRVRSEKENRRVCRWEASFQLGYKGVKELAYRSGNIGYLDAMEVREKDVFEYQLGTSRYLKHIPYDGVNPGDVVRYYAICKLKGSDDCLFKVWSQAKVLAHAKRFSGSWKDDDQRFFGPWATDFDAMAKKTVLLDCLNLAPKSIQFAAQTAADNSVKSIPLETNGLSVMEMLQQPNEAMLPGGEEEEVDGADGASDASPERGDMDDAERELLEVL